MSRFRITRADLRKAARAAGQPEAREQGGDLLFEICVEALIGSGSHKLISAPQKIIVAARSLESATTLGLGALFGLERAQLLVERSLMRRIDAAERYEGEGFVVSTRGRALTGRVRVIASRVV